ncbi:kelch-like protein 18 [Branchiostoma floridae]|uniref:Kelch-like protein 18 n=1 Tax=Branchiostoma floridae TaxID=7739 RepID=A0A9J7N4I5_BRAFL|nr:kelch-like protein 18 [Branchiostoma floridae]
MFSSDMAEIRQKTVVLQGLNAVAFEEILSYIYSGTLRVTLDKVQSLYQAANLLRLSYVRDTCSSYMVKNMEVESSNCVNLYKFADVFSQDIVRGRCQQWIIKHFTEVSLCNGSNELLFMNPREGKYISCSYKPEDMPWISALTVTSDNDIYILTPNDEVHKYDPSEDSWWQLSSPKLLLHVSSAVHMESEIFWVDEDFSQTIVYDTCYASLPTN